MSEGPSLIPYLVRHLVELKVLLVTITVDAKARHGDSRWCRHWWWSYR